MIASTFVGIVVGLFAKKLNVNEGEFSKKDVVTYAIANVTAHAVRGSALRRCWTF